MTVSLLSEGSLGRAFSRFGLPAKRCSGAKAHTLLLALAFLLLAPVHSQAQRVVNLELVLLVDVSASVDAQEYKLQTKGLASAFHHPAVLDAIRSVSRGGVAVSIVQWADHEHQELAVDWTLLRQEADSLSFAQRVSQMPRLIDGGHTALGNALAFAQKQIEINNYAGLRRVIDLSGDGRSNDGRSLSRTRNEVIGSGITINGLAILNEIPLLASYFRKHLIGGDGAFVMTAKDYHDFADAIRKKLEQEIRSAPVAALDGPDPRPGTRVAAELDLR